MIFEADDRADGMTAHFDFGGLSIERYYHFHCISDHAFLQVLDELGLSDRMNWVETKMGYWYQDKVQPWGNPIALLKFSGLSFLAKFRYGLHAFLSTKRNNWKPLDHVEATGRTKRLVGAEAYEVLWRRLFDYKFYDYTSNLSAAWIWSRIRRIGRSRYSLFKEKLGYLEGGSETLLHGLRDYIQKNGGEFRLATPVSKVLMEDGNIHGVEAAGEQHAFDKVISTLPMPYVPRLMPDLPEATLKAFGSANKSPWSASSPSCTRPSLRTSGSTPTIPIWISRDLWSTATCVRWMSTSSMYPSTCPASIRNSRNRTRPSWTK